ncbi:MAG: hypothetical protein ACRDJV_15470 [Actinomycetota bacterium]
MSVLISSSFACALVLGGLSSLGRTLRARGRAGNWEFSPCHQPVLHRERRRRRTSSGRNWHEYLPLMLTIEFLDDRFFETKPEKGWLPALPGVWRFGSFVP